MTGEEAERKTWYQNLISLISIFVAVTFCILYTGYSNEKSDQRWCSLMVSLDERYQAIPKDTITPDAARFAAQIHELRRDFKCGASSAPPVSSQVPSPRGS